MPRLNVALKRIKKSVKQHPLRWGAGALLLLILLYREYTKKLLTGPSKSAADATENAVQGSDQSNVQLDLGDPFNGLQQLKKLDDLWGPEIEAYRAKHDLIFSNIGLNQGQSRRFPTRWAVLRLTLDQQMKGNDVIGISDPYDGQLKPEWGALLSTYSPTAEDVQHTAAAVEAHYTQKPQSSFGASMFSDVLDGLKGLVASTAAMVSGNYGQLAKIMVSRAAGSGAPEPFDVARPLAKDEQVILDFLRAKIVDVIVDTPTVDRLRRMTGQEALSGGGVGVFEGLNSLGGAQDFGAFLRTLPLSPQARALDNLGLSLKAVLIARRVPVVSTSIEQWAYRSAAGEIDYNSMGDL